MKFKNLWAEINFFKPLKCSSQTRLLNRCILFSIWQLFVSFAVYLLKLANFKTRGRPIPLQTNLQINYLLKRHGPFFHLTIGYIIDKI